MTKKNYKKESQYVDPFIKVVEISGAPILADSYSCFLNSQD